ncbi:MAG: hypothetical protein OHK0019_29910 [Saprospiraceae bacterium]
MTNTAFLLLVALLLAPFSLQAQAYTRVYRSELGTKEMAFSDLSLAPDGSWFAAGQGVGNFQMSVAKFDKSGDLLWAKISDNRHSVSSIVALQNGGVMVFGNNQDFQSYFDASAMLLDAEGNFISETIWGQPGDIDGWTEAKRFANGEVLAMGTTLMEDLFIDQLLLAKFSDTGDFLWEKSFIGGFANIIEIPDNGGFYLAGANLARFDADGEPLWGKTYDFGGEDIGIYKGVRCPDGSLIFMGWDRRIGFTNEHILLLKTDVDGEPLWVKSFDGPKNMGAFQIHLLNDTTVLVAATSSTQSFPILDNDNLILRFSTNGALLGSLAFGSDTKDFPFDSFLDGDEIVMCGATNDAGGTDSTRAYISRSGLSESDCIKDFPVAEVTAPQLPTVGDLDLLPLDVTVKTDFPGTLSDLDLSGQVTCGTVSTQPEPGPCGAVFSTGAYPLNDVLQAIEPLAEESRLRVFDISGKLIFEKNNPAAFGVLSQTTPLPPGIYIYSLQWKACGTMRGTAGKIPVGR